MLERTASEGNVFAITRWLNSSQREAGAAVHETVWSSIPLSVKTERDRCIPSSLGSRSMETSLLGMKPFDHPAYVRFTSAFEDILRAEARASGGLAAIAGDSFMEGLPTDTLIQALAARDPRALQGVLNRAVKVALQGNLPFDPLGDAVFCFGIFILTHHRLPRMQRMIQDVLHLVKTSGELSRPERVFVTDKELGKIFVSGLAGDEYVIPTYGVLKNETEIDRFSFPPDCAIKPTNQSGPKLLIKGGQGVDRSMLKSWLKGNHYYNQREANYKTLRCKIIVEELLKDCVEVKIFCVDGQPRALKYITSDARSKTGKTTDFFTSDFRRLELLGDVNPNSLDRIAKPRRLEEMMAVARKLSQHFNFVRIDFYTDDRIVKVGEITNCDNAGLNTYLPKGAEVMFSNLLFNP